MELAEKLAHPAERTSPDDAAPVWDLFTDAEQIERTMTAILRDRISKKLGIKISDAERTTRPPRRRSSGYVPPRMSNLWKRKPLDQLLHAEVVSEDIPTR